MPPPRHAQGRGWAEEDAAVEQKLPTAFDPAYAIDVARLKKDFQAEQVDTFLLALAGA